MKRHFLATVAVLLALSPFTVFAQSWPVPQSSATATPQSCSGCPAPRTTNPSSGQPPAVAPLPLYGEPLIFTGRYLDSTWVPGIQQTFRTGRAYAGLHVPERDRLYLMIGSSVAAYKASTFFTRLEAREPLWPSTNFSRNLRPGNDITERWLEWDEFFYAENTEIASLWQISLGDSQDVLLSFDSDDRGYLYIGAMYGWGIVKDSGGTHRGLVQALFQEPNNVVYGVYVIKTASGRYYAFLNKGSGDRLEVWDVTNVSSPTKVGTFPEIANHISLWSLYPAIRLAKATTRTGMITRNGKLHIYENDLMPTGTGAQVFNPPPGTAFNGIASDGTNFYVTSSGSSKLVISVYAPSGATFTVTTYEYPGSFGTHEARYTDGYLAVLGNDASVGGNNLRLYRINAGVPAQVALPDFIGKFYPVFHGVIPVKMNNKLYLVINASTLGDVFQVRSDDQVAPLLNGAAGTINPKAAARVGNEFFYGDKVSFTATAVGAARNVQWNFGNPEAAGDPNIVNGVTGPPGVTHQYSGLTPATLGTTRTVTVTDLASGTTSSLNVQVKMPAARFGVGDYPSPFTQAEANSPAPIVAGDAFHDASDGDVEGHYSEWKLDSAPAVKLKPWSAVDAEHLFPAGGCGAHTLTFTAHYGPYSGFVTNGPDFPLSVGPVGYTVRPFAAAIGAPVDGGSLLTFRSLSRASADATALPPSVATQLTYRWDLVDAQESVLFSGPTGTGSISSIPDWNVAKTSFNQRGIRARLTITSPALTGACAGMETSKAFTKELNGPDPLVNGGCTNGGPPCSFNVSSQSGTNMTVDGWTFAWSGSGPAAVIAPDANKAVYTPTFTVAGVYTITVTVSNAVGSRQSQTTVNVVTPGTTCPQMTPANVFIGYRGPSSNCSHNGGTCSAGENVGFSASAFGYDFGCANHTFSWNFGDGGTASGRDVAHAFAVGTYNVTLTVSNGAQTHTVNASVSVGSSGGGGGVGGGSCPLMTAANVFVGFRGLSTNCSHLGGSCAAGENITFSASAFGYDFGCANHTFSWSFSGGGSATGKDVSHSFASAGLHTVTLTVANPAQTFTTSVAVTVGTGGGGGTCPQMTPANVFIGYRGPTSNCSHNGGTCAPAEAIGFSASAFGYDFACATHSFSWSFSDGTTATGREVTKAFATAGSHSATLTVNNGSQTHTVTASVAVAGNPNPGKPAVKAEFAIVEFGGPNVIKFTPSIDPASATVTRYAWNFGDGTELSKTSGEPVLNRYAAAGTFTVTLTVYDGTQVLGSVSKAVNVSLPRPHAARH